MSIEQVAHSAASNTQESTSGQPIEKAADKHGLDIFCHGTWNQPDKEQAKRDDVDVSTSIELVEVRFSFSIGRVKRRSQPLTMD